MRDRRFAEFAVSQAMLNGWQKDAVLLSWAPVGKCRRVIGSFEESPPLLGLEPSTTHLSAHTPVLTRYSQHSSPLPALWKERLGVGAIIVSIGGGVKSEQGATWQCLARHRCSGQLIPSSLFRRETELPAPGMQGRMWFCGPTPTRCPVFRLWTQMTPASGVCEWSCDVLSEQRRGGNSF